MEEQKTQPQKQLDIFSELLTPQANTSHQKSDSDLDELIQEEKIAAKEPQQKSPAPPTQVQQQQQLMQHIEILGAVKVRDGLFLGDEFASQDLEFVIANKVTHIINCAGRQIFNQWTPVGVKYLTFYWLDDDRQLIFDDNDQVAKEIYDFIEEAYNESNGILVHSVRGQSRACCVLSIYLMMKFRWTLLKSLEFINSRRPNLEIRASFLQQLSAWERRTRDIYPKRTDRWDELYQQDQSKESQNPYLALNEELLLRNTFMNAQMQSVNYLQQWKNDVMTSLTQSGRIKTKIKWGDNHDENQRELLVRENSDQDLINKEESDIQKIENHRKEFQPKAILKKKIDQKDSQQQQQKDIDSEQIKKQEQQESENQDKANEKNDQSKQDNAAIILKQPRKRPQTPLLSKPKKDNSDLQSNTPRSLNYQEDQSLNSSNQQRASQKIIPKRPASARKIDKEKQEKEKRDKFKAKIAWNNASSPKAAGNGILSVNLSTTNAAKIITTTNFQFPKETTNSNSTSNNIVATNNGSPNKSNSSSILKKELLEKAKKALAENSQVNVGLDIKKIQETLNRMATDTKPITMQSVNASNPLFQQNQKSQGNIINNNNINNFFIQNTSVIEVPSKMIDDQSTQENGSAQLKNKTQSAIGQHHHKRANSGQIQITQQIKQGLSSTTPITLASSVQNSHRKNQLSESFALQQNANLFHLGISSANAAQEIYKGLNQKNQSFKNSVSKKDFKQVIKQLQKESLAALQNSQQYWQNQSKKFQNKASIIYPHTQSQQQQESLQIGKKQIVQPITSYSQTKVDQALWPQSTQNLNVASNVKGDSINKNRKLRKSIEFIPQPSQQKLKQHTNRLQRRAQTPMPTSPQNNIIQGPDLKNSTVKLQGGNIVTVQNISLNNTSNNLYNNTANSLAQGSLANASKINLNSGLLGGNNSLTKPAFKKRSKSPSLNTQKQNMQAKTVQMLMNNTTAFQQMAQTFKRKNQQQIQNSMFSPNSNVENNSSKPSFIIGQSGQGLPPKGLDHNRRNQEFQNMMQVVQQQFHTEGDSLSQSIEDSGQLGTEGIVDKNTDDYIVDMKKGNSNILVGVRCRPLSTKEKQKQSVKSVKILDEKIIILQDVSAAKPEEAFRLARSKEKTYAFDYAFDENCNQIYVFERTTKFLIDGIMQGYNASVFAYGSTGAGKTYTMLGTEEQPGIMMLSIDELFNSIEKYQFERDYKLKISYVEVYNENIKDLLNSSNEYLDLREDGVKGVCVAGVTEIMTTNVDEIMRYIRQGNRQRTKERTDANEASSRSHAVLQITVEHKDKAHGINAEINIAKLSLIDLAGSERASNTNNRGLRLVEGANINKSLLALGNCINALCEQTKSGQSNKNQHIPYRDSKLTRLLKDSLGGNCRTVMIANISPAFAAYEDTLNTLKYADRAKQIKTIVKRNVLNVEFHISNYTKIINQLREEIVNLRGQLQNSAVKGVGNHINSLSQQNQSKSGPNGNNNINQIAQNKLKSMKIEMNLQFEKEVTIKKEIYELDMKNEDLAFKLFSKQLNLTKNKNKVQQNSPQIEQEIKQLKQEIDGNHAQKAQLNQNLVDLENLRTKMLDSYQQEMLQYDIEAIDVLYNQHLLNLKQIDIKRKENRAEFHIRQRDNYIQHLKEQLSLRDRIIKEKLGVSMTNFNGGGAAASINSNSNTLGTTGSYDDPSFQILSMQDIDKMSRELILPSAAQQQIINSNGSNKVKIMNLKSIQGTRSDDESGGIKSYKNQLKFSNISTGLTPGGVNNNQYQNIDHFTSKIHRPPGSSLHKNSQAYHQNALLSDKKASPNKNSIQSDLNYESDQNLSFQSQRNNSISKIGMGVNHAYNGFSNQLNQQQQQLLQQQIQFQNISVQPPNTSGAELQGQNGINQAKSFASEMSKNKQKFLLMQRQQMVQNPSDVFATRGGRAIPKNPLSINKKLSLLKKNMGLNNSTTQGSNGHASGDESTNNTVPLVYQSSRNQSQNPISRIGMGTSNLIINNNINNNNSNGNSNSSINHFSIRRPSDSNNNYNNAISKNNYNGHGGNSINTSAINIADNI